MRKVERKMIAAIRDGVTDKTVGGNTRVHAIIGGHEVQLFGNIIAHVDASRGTMRFTMAGYGTPTTRSRINALLREFGRPQAGVFQRKGAQYYCDSTMAEARELDTREWVQS